MHAKFESIEAALRVLASPGSPDWGDAFAYLSAHPETSALMLEVFRETLEEMGVEPSGNDPETGEPSYDMADVAKALGASESELDLALHRAGLDQDDA